LVNDGPVTMQLDSQSPKWVDDSNFEKMCLLCYENLIDNSNHSEIQLTQLNHDWRLIRHDELEFEFWTFCQQNQM